VGYRREDTKKNKDEQKRRIKNRYNVTIDESNYRFFPAKKQLDYYDNDVPQRVAVYARVSTDNVAQTTSYELQRKYYEEFVTRHPNWTLVHIYADEGISGTSTLKRDEFVKMIADCEAGKIDMIITKSVSRFARNVEDFVKTCRQLAELNPRVGVFFESEALFSLNDESSMSLTFHATMAEEESHIRSRSMETSLRMRLDHGIPLTPKLYGYTHDENGELIINPDEAPTVRLMFYMYLLGYSTQQIAETLIEHGRKSYFGLLNWTSSGVASVLRNERHCGDVLTRKTFTPNFKSHKSRKNRGDRNQSLYMNHHEPIVSRDDFNAVQRMLDNAKFGRSLLPELRVIDSGFLKGFVIINPRWASFKDADYLSASRSVYNNEEETDTGISDVSNLTFEVAAGDFDLRGFEIARSEFFDSYRRPYVTFENKKLKFSSNCVRHFSDNCYAELLINPVTRRFAIRPAERDNRQAVMISKPESGKLFPKDIPAGAFGNTIYSLFGWNPECKYRMTGSVCENEEGIAYIFDTEDCEVFFKSNALHKTGKTVETEEVFQPLTPVGKHIRAIPEKWTTTFGKQFYLHELSFSDLDAMTKADWELQMQGQLFETGTKLQVTGFEELRSYITNELGGITPKEVINGRVE